MKTIIKAIVVATFLLNVMAVNVATAQRTYDVNHGTATVDGTISFGEWDDAIEAGDFRLLRTTNDPDSENTRLRMMCDSTALYLLYESDFGDLNGPNGGINFSADSLWAYFDPNTDGELNTPGGEDGYTLAFSLPSGDASNVIPFSEARNNSLFGNNAGTWSEFSGINIEQSNDSSGGLAEILIPWDQFNAAPGGLFHPMAPTAGDEWYFNLARISSRPGSPLPIFNHHSGSFFAERPMAVITFVAVPEPSAFSLTFLALCGLGFRRRRNK